MDLYSYQVVTVTSLVSDAINHLLSTSVRRDVPIALLRELETWKEFGTAVDKDVDIGEESQHLITFSLLRKIHNQLQITPLGIRWISITAYC